MGEDNGGGGSFDVDLTGLGSVPGFAGLASALGAHSRIDSAGSFNAFCARACRVWREGAGEDGCAAGAGFGERAGEVAAGGAGVIRTGWGGVVVTLLDLPRVEKFLVVRRGCYLALEKHARKVEHLEVREGNGLMLFRAGNEAVLRASAAVPGAVFDFVPGTEHCLIGLGDVLVWERGVDPKGMDRDLIFLYEPGPLGTE